MGDAGRAFMKAMLDADDVNLAQGMLLLQAAHTLDDLHVWRVSAATDKSAARMTNTLTRTFTSILVQVRALR